MEKDASVFQVFNTHAAAYADKYMDVSLYADSLDCFCNLLPEKENTLLEVGCGPGNITRYLCDKRPDSKITAWDISPAMLEIARQNNPKVHFERMDARKIACLKHPVDAVLAGFCFPYLSREEAIRFIGDAAGVLREKGVFYMSTMEDVYARSGWEVTRKGERLYIHYHESAYLEAALKKNGFGEVQTLRKNYTNDRGEAVTDLILIASLD